MAKVVLNNLFKHTQLQTTFGANMLAIVDGVPRTLRLDQFVSALRRSPGRRSSCGAPSYRLRKAEERAHILRALLKALDQLDAVIALIRNAPSAEASKSGLMDLLEIDQVQAEAILDLQLRRLAALERQRIIDEAAEIEAKIVDLNDILAKPGRQRQIIRDEMNEIVGQARRRATYPDHPARRRRVDGRPDRRSEDVVVTITRTGYAKRTKTDLYRAQRRGGKGVQGANAAHRRHRRALLRHVHPRLDPVLHQQGPGVPGQGLRAARGQSQRPRPARREPAGLPARRGRSPTR